MWLATRLIRVSALSLCLFRNSAPAIDSGAGRASAPAGTAASQSGKSTSNSPSKPISGDEASKSSGNVSAGSDPTRPVITVQGICEGSKGQANSDRNACVTTVRREKFESLMNALNPVGGAVSVKRRQTLAQAYAEAVVLENAARNAGIEDTDEFQQMMAWSRLQVAAQLYRRKLEEEYRTPAQEEVDAYYQRHLASYERVQISRVLVPRDKPEGDAEFDKKALEAANAARKRIAKGEDLKEVERDTYALLGISSPPPVNLGKYGRANFTDKEGQDVFSLKAGEVSQIEVEPRSYVIYKVQARETLTEEAVKAEISQQIFTEKFKDAIKAVRDAAPTEFDEQYFGAGINAPLVPPPMPDTPPVH